MRMKSKFLSLALSAALLLSCTMLAVQAAPASNVSKEGLEVYWNFDEGAGAAIPDKAGALAGRDLSVAGKVAYAEGRYGKGFHFDGKTILKMDGAKAIKSENITVSLWVKIESFPENETATYSFLVNEELSAISKGSMDVGIAFGGVRSYIVNDFKGSTGDECFDKTDRRKEFTNKWCHVVSVWDQDAEKSYLYLNGQKIAENSITSILGLSIKLGFPKQADYRKCALDIGGYINTEGGLERTFVGTMDDIAIYSRALTAAEIASLYKEPAAESSSTASVSSKNDQTPSKTEKPVVSSGTSTTASEGSLSFTDSSAAESQTESVSSEENNVTVALTIAKEYTDRISVSDSVITVKDTMTYADLKTGLVNDQYTLKLIGADGAEIIDAATVITNEMKLIVMVDDGEKEFGLKTAASVEGPDSKQDSNIGLIVLIVIICVVVVAGGGIGIWLYLKHHKKN